MKINNQTETVIKTFTEQSFDSISTLFAHVHCLLQNKAQFSMDLPVQ